MAAMTMTGCGSSGPKKTKGETMSAVTIYICGNSETLCSGILRDTDEDVAGEAVAAASLVFDDSGIDAKVEVDSCFSNWHGGNRRQFVGYSTGWCMTHSEVGEDVRAVMCRADDAIFAVLTAAEAVESAESC
mgnify:FL=1